MPVRSVLLDTSFIVALETKSIVMCLAVSLHSTLAVFRIMEPTAAQDTPLQ